MIDLEKIKWENSQTTILRRPAPHHTATSFLKFFRIPPFRGRELKFTSPSFKKGGGGGPNYAIFLSNYNQTCKLHVNFTFAAQKHVKHIFSEVLQISLSSFSVFASVLKPLYLQNYLRISHNIRSFLS